ncbi:MAG: phospholipase C [Solirubrobacteraceae bacterium]
MREAVAWVSMERAVTRRSALRTAAGAGAGIALGSGALPAWAKPIADAAGRVRRPGALPYPNLPEGTPTLPHIEHIVVLMLENHSFDNVLGMLPHRVRARRGVDGLPVNTRGVVDAWNPDALGRRVYATHFPSPCQLHERPSQNWNQSHTAYANGRMSGFVRASGRVAMRFYDERELPFTYGLAAHFPIGQRYFQSCLGQTYPNRRFLYAGTASGTLHTLTSELGKYPPPNGTIFDRLDAHGISSISFYQDVPAPLIVPGTGRPGRFEKLDRFYARAAAGALPAVSFVDANFTNTSEENPQDVEIGETFLHDVAMALMRSPTWGSTALFVTYDEHGGYYDHVRPPRAIAPDSTPPRLAPGDVPGAYDRYGFRVPLLVVSPWARRRYVSKIVQDHTSILRFIERKYNIGALTLRDANAADMTDYFDFSRPHFATPPTLPGPPDIGLGLAFCQAQGLTPPLPGP